MKRHDWRLLPIAAAAWAAAWIGTSGWVPERSGWIAGLVGLLLVAAIAWRAGHIWVAAVLMVLAITLLASGMRSVQRHSSHVAVLATRSAVATVEFSVTTEPVRRRGVVVAQSRLTSAEFRGERVSGAVPVVVLAAGNAGNQLLQLVPGTIYQAKVKFGPSERTGPEAAVLSLRRLEGKLVEPGALRSLANGMRMGLRRAMSHSPPAQAALVPSLVVGDTTRVDEAMRRDFQSTGLTHLMAVSGANLTLMVGVVLAFVRAIGVRGWWVRIAAVGAVGLFVLVCGEEPSVLRATAMGIVALAATGVSSGSRSTGALCLAATLLMWWDPWLSRSVGFALSVSACAGIVLLGPLLRDALMRWCPRWIAEALAISLAAQLATQPIVTAISDQISVVGVAANVLAAPFVGPTTVLGLIAAVLSGLGAISIVPGWLAGWAAQPILWVAGVGAALPSATLDWEPGPLGIAALTVGSVVLAVMLVWLLRYPLGGAIFAAVLAVSGLVRPVPFGWPGDWVVAFCDVGQGDATAIRAGPGAAMLIDAGPDEGPTLACLADLGVRQVPLLLLTHYHADHVGGARAVIEEFSPALVLVRAGSPPQWLEGEVRRSGGQLRSATNGEVLQLGDATWVTASVPEHAVLEEPRAGEEDAAENDASVVGIAEVGGVRVLLAGDAEPRAQAEALRSADALGIRLEADVLKLPHHGSSRQEASFFEASGASLAVASAGRGNDYGHPARKALDLATGLGMGVARTDEQGTIVVRRTDDGLAFVPQR